MLQDEVGTLRNRLGESEAKVGEAKSQIEMLLARDKKTTREKRDAQRQLDRARLQIARSLR